MVDTIGCFWDLVNSLLYFFAFAQFYYRAAQRIALPGFIPLANLGPEEEGSPDTRPGGMMQV